MNARRSRRLASLAGAPRALFQMIGRHWMLRPLRDSGLKAAALRGSLWTTLGYGSGRVLQLGSNLILTRLLFPEAFGLMALVNVVLVGLHMFSDVGITPSIVQNPRGEDAAFLNTAWTVQVIRGFTLWTAACLAAWPASLVYGRPVLFPLLCVVGSTAAINGFQSFALATASRNLRFGRLTVIQISGQFISISVTIVLAYVYYSVWSLAIGSVIGAVLQTILGHLAFPSRNHAIRLDRDALRSLAHFGRWIFLATLVTFLGSQGLRAVQGLLVSPGVLGTIYIATMIPSALGELTTTLTGTVGFSAFAKLYRENPHRMKEILEYVRLRILGLTLPGFVLLSVISTPLIEVLYDKRYTAAGGYLAISAIDTAFAVVPIVYQTVLLSVGKSRAHFIIMSFLMTLRIVGLLAGFHAGGIDGMLVGIAVATFVHYFVAAWFAHKEGWLSLRVDLTAMAFILAGAGASLAWHIAGH